PGIRRRPGRRDDRPAASARGRDPRPARAGGRVRARLRERAARGALRPAGLNARLHVPARSTDTRFMTRSYWNLIIGAVFVVGGLSGRLVLLGTSSGPALAVLGA